MTTPPQDDLTAERAAIYKYHKVFDGYNFLSGPKGMEEIVGHDMELVSLEDHIDALTTARQEALREAAKVARETNEEEPFQTYVILEALDRLASEGG